MTRSAITREDYAKDPQAVLDVLEFYTDRQKREAEMEEITGLTPSISRNPSAGPSSTQGNKIEIKFINVGNLTAGIDIPEVGLMLDLMPTGSETRQLLDIDPNKAYSLKFSLRDSAHEVVERYVIR